MFRMKYAPALIVFCALVCVAVANPTGTDPNTCDFAEYMKKWAKVYDSPEAQDLANATYTAHCQAIHEHNNQLQTVRAVGHHGFQQGDNEWTDVPNKQFMNEHTGFKPRNHTGAQTRAVAFDCAFNPSVTPSNPPTTYDARQLGLVNTPSDQGRCGDCYAFSAAGAIEAAYKKKSGTLVQVSTQQFASCFSSEGNLGCNGGNQPNAFVYAHLKGVELASDYPYSAKGGKLAACAYSAAKATVKIASCAEYQHVSASTVQQLLVQNGVLSAVMDASGNAFQNYKSGIYTPNQNQVKCGNTFSDVNHAVLIVGYGNESGTDYWIVKNSWGTSWGEGGYFRIPRGSNACGIELDVSYVTM